MGWTDSDKAEIQKLWEAGKSANEIAIRFHVSRNAICGLCNRNHWQTPNKPHNHSGTTRDKKNRQPPVNVQRSRERQRSATPMPPMERDPVPTVDDLAIPMEQRRTLLELTDKTCRFPIGSPGVPGFFFCGAEPIEGYPYCAGAR